MDKKALYNLSYGVFMLATRSGNVVNGCITNTCIQVANNPVRIAISVLNSNYTCDLIKESGIFTLSLLDQTCSFETIRHFGFQSGRDVDKFANITAPADENAVPYLGWQTCSVLSAKVVSRQDLGTHTLFIAEVTDAKLLSDNPPLTYADYQTHVKPNQNRKKRIRRLSDGAVRSAIMYTKEAIFRKNSPARSVDTAQMISNRFMKMHSLLENRRFKKRECMT